MPATYLPIASTVLLSDTASVTFSSISGYTDLMIRIWIRGDDTTAYSNYIRYYPNNNQTSIYSRGMLYADGSSNLQQWSTSSAGLTTLNANSNGNIANTFTCAQIYIPSYANTGQTFQAGAMSIAINKTDANAYSHVTSNSIATTSAITSIVFNSGSANIVAGSRIDLYGISAV